MLEVASEPAAGHAVNIGPLRGRKLAAELADQLTSLYRLRHCGRTLRLREHPSAYGQMGRCCSPCLGDLDPNAYRRQLDAALGLFDGPDGGRLLIEESTADGRGRRERRSSAPPRCCGAASGWPGCSSGSTASCAPPTPLRALCWPATRSRTAMTHSGSCRPGGRLGLAARPHGADGANGGRARARRPRAPGPLPADEVDELRIVWGWLAEHELAELALDPAPSAPALLRFVGAATAPSGWGRSTGDLGRQRARVEATKLRRGVRDDLAAEHR